MAQSSLISNKLQIAVLVALGWCLWGVASVARADGSLAPVFVLLTPNSDGQAVETAIDSHGGHVTHMFPGHALIAQLPAAAVAQIEALPAVAAVYTGPVELAEMDPFGSQARQWAVVWNSLVAPQVDLLAAVQLDALHPDQRPDSFVAPDQPAPGLATAATSGRPGYYDTSEFMAGSVAVGIVLLESNGKTEASTEDWTTDEKQLVLAEIVNACNWWASLNPAANLTFVYDDHATSPLPTGVEPIRHSSFDTTYGEPRWIADAMTSLGYTGYSYFSQVRNYNDALRNSYNTDWAFTIFVVDSTNDTDNKFSDGYFAYAYLGGPFMVMTSENNGYGAGNMDAVAAHEMGHIFNALDQYYNAKQNCTLTAGYLQVENQNSQYGGCSSNVNSIMRGQTTPYTSRAIDVYAAGQVGWRDSDSDGIIDPLDVALPVTIDSFEQDEDDIIVIGSAEITPYPSPTGYSFTINEFSSVQYRLDDGDWQPAIIGGLENDGLNLSYGFATANIPVGRHTVQVAAVDNAGNISAVYAAQEFTVEDAVDGGLNTELNPSTSQIVTGVAYHSRGGVVAGVEYRVDNGDWQAATPQDGAFDEAYEEFTIILEAVTTAEVQRYVVEARAIDEEGNPEINTASEEVQIGGTYSVFIPVLIRGM